ncbi:Ribosomal protein 50S-L18Ae/60S-L20/60S-L18A [Sesbania bispinosa]|nr:Ribosomal protein 50S-L18Ae/60S-L20/60S-L18A [Sesbania bispinosa]
MVTFRYHQYQVVGRALPTENDEHPKIYRMKLWATNEVHAKSKFWYFLRKLKKVKKSNGQVLAINEKQTPNLLQLSKTPALLPVRRGASATVLLCFVHRRHLCTAANVLLCSVSPFIDTISAAARVLLVLQVATLLATKTGFSFCWLLVFYRSLLPLLVVVQFNSSRHVWFF